VPGTLDVAVDDTDAGFVSHEISHSGRWLRFGAPRIGGGEHQLRPTYSRGWLLRAGRGTPATRPPLGPIAVPAPEDDGELPIIEIPPKRARSLYDGRSFDWIEALA